MNGFCIVKAELLAMCMIRNKISICQFFYIDAMIAQMQAYQGKGFLLILTSHYAPETLDKVAVKIAYLETAKELIVASNTAEEFITGMKVAFPACGGENYLEMSAGILFQQ